MTNAAEEIQSYFEKFQSSPALQAEYQENPIAFLKQSELPQEYIDELIGTLNEIEQLKSQSNEDEVKHLSNYQPEVGPLMGPAKGKPTVKLQKYKNKFGWLLGYHLVLNNQATDDVSDGLMAVATLTGLIAAANPEIISKTVAAGIAAALFAEGSAMKIVNRGRGVYYYLNPLLIGTPALLVSLIPLPN